MTIEQMHERFDLIQDKYESPYFTSEEKDHFINLSQDALFLKLDFMPFDYLLQRKEVSRGFESNEVNTQHLKNFIIDDLNITLSSGLASFEDINSAIQNKTGGDEELFRVISVSIDDLDARWVRHNDLNRFERNKYLRGTEKYPIYTYNNDGLKIRPSSIQSCKVSVLRKHKDVSLENSIDSEFPESIHHKILYDALVLSGIPVKDFDLNILKENDRNT